MRRALAAGGMAVALVALIAAPPLPTLAAWTDTENATGSFSALKVPAPVLGATCTLEPGVLGATPVITITWTLPTGYALTDIRYGISGPSGIDVITGPLLSSVTTTGTGPYTTKFGPGLLSGLLGSTKTVGVRTQDSSGWTSGWATATASAGALGINPTCTVNASPA